MVGGGPDSWGNRSIRVRLGQGRDLPLALQPWIGWTTLNIDICFRTRNEETDLPTECIGFTSIHCVEAIHGFEYMHTQSGISE